MTNMQTPSAKLPSFLFEPYQQYKRDTSRLASWLGATATSLGYFDSHTAPTPKALDADDPAVPAKSGRLKGKARKVAKEQQRTAPAADDNNDASAAAVQPTLLSTAQFLQLAQYIVDYNQPPIVVPRRILAWATSAINSRRACAVWFQSASDKNDASFELSNQSHEHFIGVLSSVITILGPRVGAGRSSQPKAGTGNLGGVELVESRFSALAVDEEEGDTGSRGNNEGGKEDAGHVGDEQDDWDEVDQLVRETVGAHVSDSSSEPSQTKKSRHANAGPKDTSRLYERFELQDSDSVRFMYCYSFEFLHDLAQVRRFVLSTWIDFVSGTHQSLETASLATTAAVNSAHSTCANFLKSYPSFAIELLPTSHKFISLMMRVHRRLETEAATVPIDTPLGPLQFQPDLDAFHNAAQFTFMYAHEVLETFRKQGADSGCSKPTSPTTTSHHVDPCTAASSDPSPDFQRDLAEWRLRHAQSLSRDVKSLTRLYSHWTIANRFLPNLLAAPPIIRELESLLQDSTDNPIPLSTCVTAQIYFDIASRTRSNIKGIADHAVHRLFSTVYAFRQTILHVSPLKSVTSTIHTELKQLCFRALPWYHPNAADFEIGPLLAIHPWYAGILAARAETFTRIRTVNASNKSPVIFQAAFLYVAVDLAMRDYGLPSSPPQAGPLGWWPLMDDLFACIGKARFFFGRDPDTLIDLWQSLMQQHGFSGADISSWISQRYAKSGRGPPHCREMPNRAQFKLEPLIDAAKSPVAELLLLHVSEFAHNPERNARMGGELAQQLGECTVGKNKRLKSLSIVDYLGHIQSELLAQAPMMSLNLMLLHVQAERMLARFNTLLSPHLKFLFPKTVSTKYPNSHLVNVWEFITSLNAVALNGVFGDFVPSVGAAKEQVRRRVSGDIVVGVKQFVVEMAAEDKEYKGGSLGATEE